jgi:hypothetical protein
MRAETLKPRRALIAGAAIAAIATAAMAGHELPVYPSYYPHEVAIEAVPPERAADLLRDGKILAYLGAEPRFPGEVPESIRGVESLGSFVLLRVNPASPRIDKAASGCAMLETIARDIAGKAGIVFHPYPVTPFHGDYFYHFDRAEAAKARFLERPAAAPPPGWKIRAAGWLGQLVRPEWQEAGADWDVEIAAVDAAGLVAASMTSTNGWLAPAWVRAGWFQAERLLGEAIDDSDHRWRAEALARRLDAGGYRDGVERINLERDLVALLAGNCREMVAGYTVKHEFFSAEFTEGVENIAYDAISGLNAPMFIRTVKLKNFPWNGWLSLGVDGAPQAAWNPIAGFDDPFGRLLWSALGDPALVPAPYDAGWMLNRIADVQSSAVR